MKKGLRLIISLAIPLAVGAIASWFTSANVRTWYPTLEKPSFNPPNAVFGPVWTVLYILMGISLYLVWRLPASQARNRALWIFGVQLLLNFWWSIFFFEFHQIGLALMDIILLWLAIIFMIRHFLRLSPVAAHLQWPYLAWVSFATVLNASIWYLNRAA
ncbi:TspO/MBR family protein [Chitinophaga lutea]